MSSDALPPLPPPLLGAPLPPFTATTQLGDFSYSDYAAGSWLMVFSLPADFTPVCSTELATVARLLPEFESRGCKVLGIAVDKADSHSKWIDDIAKAEGIPITYPVVADETGALCKSLGFIHPAAAGTMGGKFTVRGLHVVDPQGLLQLSLMYPTSTGRNFNEVLRSLDSMILASQHKVGTPANWRPGEDVVILPSVDDAEAEASFPKGFYAIKPYLRITPQPDSA